MNDVALTKEHIECSSDLIWLRRVACELLHKYSSSGTREDVAGLKAKNEELLKTLRRQREELRSLRAGREAAETSRSQVNG
jgi:hypothetical protein